MLKQTVLLVVALLMCQVAMAASFSVKVGNEFALADVCLDRMEVGPFGLSFGIAGGVDYIVESSNIPNDFDIDVGDHYVGPVARLHVLPEDSIVDLYGSFYALYENVRVDKGPDKILEAGISVYGLGIAYQYSADRQRDDLLLLAWTGGKF